MNSTLPIRVLLVEDSERIRRSLIEQVTVPGRVEVVYWADNEREALSLLGQHSVDVAIIDLRLREGSGFGVLSLMRTLSRCANVKRIVLTNYSTPDVRERCLNLGADCVFDKSREFTKVNRLLEAIALDMEPPATSSASLMRAHSFSS